MKGDFKNGFNINADDFTARLRGPTGDTYFLLEGREYLKLLDRLGPDQITYQQQPSARIKAKEAINNADFQLIIETYAFVAIICIAVRLFLYGLRFIRK